MEKNNEQLGTTDNAEIDNILHFKEKIKKISIQYFERHPFVVIWQFIILIAILFFDVYIFNIAYLPSFITNLSGSVSFPIIITTIGIFFIFIVFGLLFSRALGILFVSDREKLENLIKKKNENKKTILCLWNMLLFSINPILILIYLFLSICFINYYKAHSQIFLFTFLILLAVLAIFDLLIYTNQLKFENFFLAFIYNFLFFLAFLSIIKIYNIYASISLNNHSEIILIVIMGIITIYNIGYILNYKNLKYHSVIYFALFLILLFIVPKRYNLSSFTMGYLKIGNFYTDIAIKRREYNIISNKKNGKSHNPVILKKIYVLSRLGNSFYVKYHNKNFSIPKSAILTWSPWKNKINSK